MKKISQRSLITLLNGTSKHYKIRSSPWIHDFDRVPPIRRDIVQAFKRELAAGTWKPDPGEVAEKMLREHLFYPIPF